ncbi:MAG: type II secretion system protein [bacterium]|nr:type II secretion system protein [bacterium]
MRKTARFFVDKGLALRSLATKGFTLVELLIVIALIGILAVAVLAAINPLEQLNRARDTGQESDMTQYLAAIDRFYVSKQEFPWVASGDIAFNDTAVPQTSLNVILAGVCGTGGCPTNKGQLITEWELKDEFANRKFAQAATGALDQLYMGKAIGASSPVYVCYVPMSKSKRAKATYPTGTVPPSGTCNQTGYTTLATSCFYCLPN